MLATLVVVFREGLEAFLVVAIMLAYLSNTGQSQFNKAVYAGVITALLISATTAWHVAGLAQEAVWEGSLAIIAGILVATFTYYVMRTARSIRGRIGEQLEKSTQKAGIIGMVGVFTFATLMIAREGMETALMLGAFSSQYSVGSMWIGGLAGISLVALVGLLWVSQSSKINLPLFLQVTGLFLILFALHLFLYGVYELSEDGFIPLVGPALNVSLHQWTSFIKLPMVEAFMSYGLFIVPVLWLGGSWIREKTTQVKA